MLKYTTRRWTRSLFCDHMQHIFWWGGSDMSRHTIHAVYMQFVLFFFVH